jgi:negative regulator of flagellin synthesis FlgM
MRIETFNQVAKLYQTSKPTKVTKTAAPANMSDQLCISQTGKDYQFAKQAVAQASEVREERVSELKSKINAGTYDVPVSDFAATLLEKYKELK